LDEQHEFSRYILLEEDFNINSLDDLINNYKIQNTNLIKMDIEGAEYNVIENFNFKSVVSCISS
jgi:FkbM family methyltransferase